MRWVALLVALVLSACSFIGVRGPESRGMDCSSNRTAPAVDTLVAVGAAVGTVAALISKSKHCMEESFSGEPSTCVQRALAGVSIVIGVPYALSAVYGYTTVSTCRRYRAHPPAT